MHESTAEGRNPQWLVILLLMSLFCMHKTTSEDWNPYRLLILVINSLFDWAKPQMRAGIHRDL